MRASLAFLALTLAGASAATAGGQFPAVQVHPEQADALVISCSHPSLPSQKKVGKVLQVDNFDRTYELRSQVMAVASRACKAGVAEALVRRDARGRLTWVAVR
jgi:hypothetical protein